MTEKIKIKIKGHESFSLREGWLRKGVSAIQLDECILGDTVKACDELGVGSNMVKSIRYWLQAVGLTYEQIVKGSKRCQKLTGELGKKILIYDEYFENIGTLFLLHYKLVTNIELATSWYIFFNKFNAKEFTKDNMIERIKHELTIIAPATSVSEKSIVDDCSCIIKTYYNEKENMIDPEDNLCCPFVELGLLKKESYSKNTSELIIKTSDNKRKLDKLIVLFVILDRLGENKSITIDQLENQECNIGKVFNLNRNDINEYMDKLRDANLINITRTAGLNEIYPTMRDKEKVLGMYYKGI